MSTHKDTSVYLKSWMHTAEYISHLDSNYRYYTFQVDLGLYICNIVYNYHNHTI